MNNGQTARRRFLTQLAALSAGHAVLGGQLSLLASALSAKPAAAQANDDYRALVCIFLYGGSDSFNMYVPTSVDQYASYASARPAALRVARESLLETSTELGFHPNLSRCHQLFQQGRLAVVQNVGNLIAPTTRTDFLAERNHLPFGLFAHDHQQEQWQKAHSSRPTSLVDSGWGGRIIERMTAFNELAAIAPNVSVDGSEFWSTNTAGNLSVHSSRGLELLAYLDEQTGSGNRDREQTLDALLTATDQHPMKQEIIARYNQAKLASREVSAALAEVGTLATPFDPSNRLAAQLNMVARLIAGRQALGMGRQVFFVGLGGWDTHQSQAVLLPDLLTSLDAACGGFYDMLTELGVGDRVVTFTASDFGRSLTINGDGTDHGWGGHYMVFGNAVAGGQLFGTFPELALGGPDDAGEDGRIIPTTSINQYGATLANWFGVDSTDLNTVFPDLANFGPDWNNQLQIF